MKEAVKKDGKLFLAEVSEKLQERLFKLAETLLAGQQEIENMHTYYWENYTEMDQYGYEDFDNQQALLHQINANNEAQLLYQRFQKMSDAPFFWQSRLCLRWRGGRGSVLHRYRKFCRAHRSSSVNL